MFYFIACFILLVIGPLCYKLYGIRNLEISSVALLKFAILKLLNYLKIEDLSKGLDSVVKFGSTFIRCSKLGECLFLLVLLLLLLLLLLLVFDLRA